MAAADEDDSQNDNKKEDYNPPEIVKPVSTMQQEIENKLLRPGCSYEDRVSIVLSGWERLAGTACLGHLPLATFLYRWTLQLVLQGEWPKLVKIVKTRLDATLQRCSKDPLLRPLCQILLPLVSDPWGNPSLRAILAGSELSDKDVCDFISTESWEVVRIRVDTMIESKCEELALNVVKACIRCLRLKENEENVFDIPEYEEAGHFFDLFFVLLYKFERDLFYDEMKELPVNEGYNLVHRLLEKEEKGKIWKNRLKIADWAIKIFLAKIIVQPYEELFWHVFCECCRIQKELDQLDSLPELIRKYLSIAGSSQHLYTMGSILYGQFKGIFTALVTEILIRGITIDMNSLERVKIRDDEMSRGEKTHLKMQMSDGFMELAEVFNDKSDVARECVLTSFSLYPTQNKLNVLYDFASKFEKEAAPQLVNDNVNVESHPLCMSETVNITEIKENCEERPYIPVSEQQDTDEVDDSLKIKDCENNKVHSVTEEHAILEDLNCNAEGVEKPELLVSCNEKTYACQELTRVTDSDKYSDVVPSYKLTFDNSDDSMDRFFKTTDSLIEQLKWESCSNKNPYESDSLVNINGDWTNQGTNYDVLSAPSLVLDGSNLNLSEHLCADLAVVLSSPRWQILSWARDWSDLSSICERYLKEGEDAMNVTKELKYLNLDYNQFKHIPSAEVDQFTGIEKGYEHYVIDDSSDSDIETIYIKRRRGRPRKNEKPIPKNGYSFTESSITESDESDSDINEVKDSTNEDSDSCYKIEGKRITAVSNSERCKRIRIDVATGKVKEGKANTNSLRLYRHVDNVNTFKDNDINRIPVAATSLSSNSWTEIPSSSLRLYRHVTKCHVPEQTGATQTPRVATLPNFSAWAGFHDRPLSPNNFAPRLGSLNLNPSVVLTQKDKSAVDQQMQKGLVSTAKSKESVTLNPKTSSLTPAQEQTSSQSVKGNWHYAGCLFSAPNVPKYPGPHSFNSPSLQCSVRTRDGKIIPIPNSLIPRRNALQNTNDLQSRNISTTAYEDSYTKFLKVNREYTGIPNITVTHKKSVNELKQSHCSYNKQKSIRYNCKNLPLSKTYANKEILNVLLSPENKISSFSDCYRQHISVLPVSHTPPNFNPADKNTPNFRVLPKGTTVLRKHKKDCDAGPSGLNNGADEVSRNPHSVSDSVSVTPSSHFSQGISQASIAVSTHAVSSSSFGQGIIFQNAALKNSQSSDNSSKPTPLTFATVDGSVPVTSNNESSTPDGTQGGSEVEPSWSLRDDMLPVVIQPSITRGATTTTTTVACQPGDTRGASVLETLLRDPSIPSSPLLLASVSAPASTSVTAAIPRAVSSISPGIAMSGSSTTYVGSNTHTINIASNSTSHSRDDNVSGGIVLNSSVVGANEGIQQVLLPGHIVQVHSSDGSSGYGIVQSASLGLPVGTRVIKSNVGTVKSSAANIISTPSVQSAVRQVNLLHNVKILQNRQFVRTVVVPHSVALQGLNAQQATHLVAITQASRVVGNVDTSGGIRTKIQTASQLQKVLSSGVVPGGLVIRAVKSSVTGNVSTSGDTSLYEDGLIGRLEHATLPRQNLPVDQTGDGQLSDVSKEKSSLRSGQQDESSLSERLTKPVFKAVLAATSSTQSVGTQTQTTAVKPSAGQIVKNHLKISGVPVPGTSTISSASVNMQQQHSLPQLSLASNAVSSETLEQLREFESVFEKVSNKSVKEPMTNEQTQENFVPSSVSTEESMIAAQLLSMANEHPVTTNTSYIYSIPNASFESSNSSSTSKLSEGTYITIPSTTQPGTLILVNQSAAVASGLVTVGSVQNAPPPPAASPALSSTSSHSSVASSPSSTSSKGKKNNSVKPKVIPPSTSVVAKPKTPPLPKAPPKPAVSKPQVEESDETKARIQAILDQYKLDLANTPQPQPAPRNRKNCPPPKGDSKSSSKKKSSGKKSENSISSSPLACDSGPTPSPSPGPGCSDGSLTPASTESNISTNISQVSSMQYQTQGPSGSVSPAESPAKLNEIKTESPIASSSPVIQGVVLSGLKVDSSGIAGSVSTLPQSIGAGRVLQLIKHGGKVTAITTRQPLTKSKSNLVHSGPPPNITIQNKINMNELMENHFASFLSRASVINQTPAIISKLLQSQNSEQQIVVHSSSGPQILQQVAVHTAHSSKPSVSRIETSSCVVSHLSSDSNNESNLNRSGDKQLSIIGPSLAAVSTPSPSAELPSTPNSYGALGEESNNSEQSSNDNAPLPPFFTLTKPFMVQSQPSSPLLHMTLSTNKSDSKEEQNLDKTVTEKKYRSSSIIDKQESPKNSALSEGPHGESFTSKEQNETAMQPELNLNHSASRDKTAGHSSSSERELGSIIKRTSSRSQLSHLVHLNKHTRSSSLDSIKSETSVEEVQIPPSPATLTKQLQSAYMTEAALSPSVSHSQNSGGSSYSSPSTVPELNFNDRSTSNQDSILCHGIQQSSLLTAVSRTSTSSLVEVPLDSDALSPPSGDIYLDQGSGALSLDPLPYVTLEGRTHSPALSDLVAAAPLLPWSPRSSDSIMGQSPSLNEALTSSNLDVHQSDDSLCDSSSGFPRLFSMEGDAASVSSSTSEDLHSHVMHASSGHQLVLDGFSEQDRFTIDLHSSEAEQDRTVSSTKSDLVAHSSINYATSQASTKVESSKIDNSTSLLEDSPWRFGESDGLTLYSYASSIKSDAIISKDNILENCLDVKSDPVTIESSHLELISGDSSTRNDACKSEELHLKNELTDDTVCSNVATIHSLKLMGGVSPEVKDPSEKSLDGKLSKTLKRHSDEVLQESKRNKAKQTRKQEDLKAEDDSRLEQDSSLFSRNLRGRNISGTSDSSGSLEQLSVQYTQDFPVYSQRKRRTSHDSSNSSHDGTPPPLMPNSSEFTTGVHTRRSSSRDHAKKKHCPCCVTGEATKGSKRQGGRTNKVSQSSSTVGSVGNSSK